MVGCSPVWFISILCNFTQYALTTNFITECFGWVYFFFFFLSDVASCGRRTTQLEINCGCTASSPLPTGVGAVITYCLESQQCLGSSNISNAIYPSMSELQSKAKLC